MDADRIVEALKQLGITEYRLAGDRENITASCPFATWKHTAGRDAHPSFAVKVEPGASSPYICYACKMHGPDFRQIIWQIEALAGPGNLNKYVPDVEGLRTLLMQLESPLSMANRFRSYDGKDPSDAPDTQNGAPLDADVQAEEKARAYMKEFYEAAAPSVPKWLLEQGVAKETAKEWQVRYDKPWLRVLFPILSREGDLVGLAGRAIDVMASPKYLFFPGFRKARYLYGENRVDPMKGDLFVVEGFVGALCVWQAGYNVVALMGAYPSRAQVQKIVELVPKEARVVLWMDGDEAGKLGTEEFKRKIAGRIPIWSVFEEGKDPKHFDPPGMAKAIAAAVRI